MPELGGACPSNSEHERCQRVVEMAMDSAEFGGGSSRRSLRMQETHKGEDLGKKRVRHALDALRGVGRRACLIDCMMVG